MARTVSFFLAVISLLTVATVARPASPIEGVVEGTSDTPIPCFKGPAPGSGLVKTFAANRDIQLSDSSVSTETVDNASSGWYLTSDSCYVHESPNQRRDLTDPIPHTTPGPGDSPNRLTRRFWTAIARWGLTAYRTWRTQPGPRQVEMLRRQREAKVAERNQLQRGSAEWKKAGRWISCADRYIELFNTYGYIVTKAVTLAISSPGVNPFPEFEKVVFKKLNDIGKPMGYLQYRADLVDKTGHICTGTEIFASLVENMKPD